MDQVSRDVAVAADGSMWIVGDSQGLVAFEAGASADESTFLTFAARLDAAGGEPPRPRCCGDSRSALRRTRSGQVHVTVR